MKTQITKILLSGYFLFVSFRGDAQIKINFQTKMITGVPSNLQEGDTYTVEVDDINPNLYKISIGSRDTLLNSGLKLPDFGSFSIAAITQLVGAISPLTTSGTVNAAQTNMKDYNYISAKVKPTSKIKDFEKKMQRIAIVIDPVKQRIKNEQDSVKKYYTILVDEKKSLDLLNFRILKYQLKSQLDFQSGVDYNALKDDSFSFAWALDKVQNLRTTFLDLQFVISLKSDDYTAFSNLYKNIISTYDDEAKTADTEIKMIYPKMVLAISSASDSLSPSKVSPILSSLIYIDNNAKNTYTSFPIQFKGEQANVSINITPQNANAPLQSYSSQIVFPLNKLSYFGIGTSFYVSRLYNEAYSILGTLNKNDTITYKLVDENPKQIEFGTTILFRWGSKFAKMDIVGIHFAAGPGISISNVVRPRMLYGGGLSIGRRNMVTIDVGGISGYVDRKSNAFDTTTEYIVKPTTATVAKLDTEWFAALGYTYRF